MTSATTLQSASCIYTDGGYSMSRKLGAYAIVILSPQGEHIHSFCKGLRNGTNQVAELRAMWMALSWALQHPSETYIITTDSQYVCKGLNEWLVGWKRANWVNAAKKPVANLELWQLLDALWQQVRTRTRVTWVKGHAGNRYNEMADELCSAMMETLT